MTVSKKSHRKQAVGPARRRSPESGQADLLHVLDRLCVQLQRVASTFERIGGLVERHLRNQVGASAPAPEPLAPPAPRAARQELPGQQLLPLESVRRIEVPAKQRGDPGRPWPFDQLARAALDLVRINPDREWDGASLCKALKEGGARMTSWRGLPVKVTAHLMKAQAIVPTGGLRFRAAAPAETRKDRAAGGAQRAGRARQTEATPARLGASIADRTTDERPWTIAKLMEIASALVQRDRARQWTGPDICQALVQEGARLKSWRGVPMKITAELKRRGVIRAVTRASFRVVGPAPTPDRAVDGRADAQQGERTVDRATTSLAIPWDEIIAAAQRCLKGEPDREWTWTELARAARATGLTSPTWKGVHIGLVAKLEALGLVERIDAQHVRAVRTSVQPVPEAPESTTASEPAESGGEHVEPDGPAPDRATTEADAASVASTPPESTADSVHALADEIEKLGPWLAGLSQRQRTAQVAAWAGRVRRLQEALGNLKPDQERRARDELRPMLGGLARLAKKHGCDWVDALSSEWEAEDWDGYVQYNHAIACGHAPTLSREQEELYHRDRLRGLFNPHRRTARRDAPDAIREAFAMLAENDAVVARAVRAFGRPPERREEPVRAAPPFRRRHDAPARPDEPVALVREVPADVLAITRGKHALVAGGQGAREAHRAAIQKSLQLERLEWVYGERGKSSHFSTLEGRMRPGRYDLVLLLASHSGHSSNGLVDACRDAKIPLVYLARGYSVTSVIEAIRQQLLARRIPEWMEKR